jgi:endonuclease/exonuclease/phosphatase family metal-dependent hydrolase
MALVRLLTLNTWGTRGAWEEREARFRERLGQLAPDIVTLQETVRTAEIDQARRLLGTDFHIVEGNDREPGGSGVPSGQGITIASRWPIGRRFEVDLNLTERTGDFACTSLVAEVLAPPPLGRIWVANHFPDYQLDHERERRLQAAAAARAIERVLAESPGHAILAGDLDADQSADSMRFLTGRHVIDDLSVCYRDAWEALHHGEPLITYEPDNPYQQDPDWPFRGIDHVLVRCGPTGPTLLATACARVFDLASDTVSDHYGLVVDYVPAPAGR